MTNYETALYWYSQGMKDAHNDGVITPGAIEGVFNTLYGNQLSKVIDHEGSGWQDQYEFKLPNGGKVVVGKLSTDFFEKIRALPVPTKLDMMNITVDDMLAAFEERKLILISAIKLVFGSKWLDRTENTLISFSHPGDNEYRFGLPYSSRSIIAGLENGKLDAFKVSNAIFEFIRKECKPKVLKGKIGQFDTAHFRLIKELI